MVRKLSSRHPAKARIRKRPEILHCQEKGKKLYCKHFLLFVSPNSAGPRLAVTVTTKLDKRAVARNKIKRRIREFFRLNRGKLKEPIDLVVVARRDAQLCTMQDIRKELLGALRYHGYLG